MAKLDVVEVRPGVYQIPSPRPGSHVYLLRGSSKNLLIDPATTAHFPHLRSQLKTLGLRPRDINFVILTHEHFDHIGAASYFYRTALIAAHRLAANKIELQDEFVTFNKYLNKPARPFKVHLWLEDNNTIDLGDLRLRILHTPGHASGCICIYEMTYRLLFTGDAVFAKGTLSDIAASGNISDYSDSMERLSTMKIDLLCPGHGRLSDTPEQDMQQAVVNARDLLKDSQMLFEAVATEELQKLKASMK